MKPANKPRKPAAKAKPVKLLSGGNPQIAKADGDAPVQAYLAAMPGWKREISLVPQLHCGTHLSAQFHCPEPAAR